MKQNDSKTMTQKIRIHRRTCKATGTGLSHYVLVETGRSAVRPSK